MSVQAAKRARAEAPPAHNYFSKMPDAIQTKFFEFLVETSSFDSLSRVNKGLAKLSNDGFKIFISQPSLRFDYFFVSAVLRRPSFQAKYPISMADIMKKNVVAIDFKNQKLVSSLLWDVIPHLESLEILQFRFIRIEGNTNVFYQNLRSRFPNLRRLDLGNSPLTNDDMGDLGKLKKLEILHAEQKKDLRDTGVVAFSQECPNLKIVDLSGCKELTDASARALAQNCLNLRGINMSHSKVSDKGASALLDLPNLTNLHLDKCTGISNAFLNAIAKKKTNLVKLSLQDNANITIIALTAVVISNPTLKHLDVSRCTAISFSQLANLQKRNVHLTITTS